ncbi:hypothetical protein H310_06822 [Aphanomyces invadans]|uniref:LNR domain-containing protein n=1 Tax=Aphanomyces invadans TaxID=157072 RepID=A0A024U488_9STRA|nr:hypothetical protein H310_06822 [Aphanomyces invadans]ETW01236.1 hypothetical protein H310_06822 [Aphanomyces invadans]|eukprot:XP_008870234.1 hypothetical protein H310_06822 [Aphanomyces invadans]
MWPQHQLSSIAPSTKAPPQALRADVLDLIAVLCCLYCFLMCFMHLGLSIFPYMQRFFGFIDPIVTATVFAMCGTLHLRGWWRMRTMRIVVNRTSKHLQDIAPLLITAHSRRQVTSTRGISSDDRIRNLVRLQTSHFNACTDLNVVHDQLQQTKRAYEDQGVRGSAIVAILSAKAEWIQVQIKVETFYRQYFGPRGAFSRRGMHYEVRLLVRECIVLPMQFVRGYKVSTLLVGPLTMAHGIVFGLHCVVVAPWIVWNFACIRYNFGLVRVFRERLVVTIILFDLVLGVVLPLSLAVPVIYNLVSDPSIIHDQAWDVYAISVIKAMLIMTLADLIAAVTPMLLLYVTLQNVHTANIDSFFTRHASGTPMLTSPKGWVDSLRRYTSAMVGVVRENIPLLQVPMPVVRRAKVSTQDLGNRDAWVASAQTIVLDAASGATDIPVELPQSSPLFRPLAAARIRWRYGVFCLYTMCSVGAGVGVSMISVRSYSADCVHADMPAYSTCARYIRPWHVVPLSRQVCHCQVLDLNCNLKGFEDSAGANWSAFFDEMHSFFDSQVASFLNFLTIRNCPMRAPYRPPPHIARFTELYILQLQNCSLDTTAIDTIDFSQYSRMLFLSFSSNSISEIPTSLQRLPPLCLGISLNRNNLYNATFPDWILPAWENLTMLYLRAANMTTFPPVLMHLEWIGIIDVTSNAIAELPPLPTAWGFWSRLYQLRLANNSLSSIPSGLIALPGLTVLTLSSNQLAECPTPPHAFKVFTIHDNPCCTNQPESCPATCAPVCDEGFRTGGECVRECAVPACLALPGSSCRASL